MKIARPAFALLFVPCLSMLLAQAPVPAKDAAPPASMEPLIVDVHESPYRSAIYYHTNVSHQRFDMRDATILDIISMAYNREDDAILGGPTWIDFDHFDVVAKVSSVEAPSSKPNQANSIIPAANPYDQIRPALQRILEERFHFKYHTEDRPLPGYIFTVAKDGLKLTEAKDPTAPTNCQQAQDKANPTQYNITCTSLTVAQLISNFGGIFPHPAVDHTGLTKPYDFTLKLAFDQIRSRDQYVRIFTDAFSRQLGIMVAPGDVSQPAVVIDQVDRPTPNSPEIVKQIPALPDLEFEVATIKPAADTEPQVIRPAGSQITFGNISLQELLVRAWQLPTGAMLGNAPPGLGQKRYTILVKLPPDIDARAVYQDQDQISNMLQKLLIDRFQIKYHWGEQPGSGYVLLAGSPKLKKADPNMRSSCGYGPPPGEKDIRESPDSPYDNESHCLNVTMDQFASVLQNLAKSEIKNRVANKTGLAGSYDITFYYSSTRKLRAEAAAAVAATTKQGGETTTDAAASDPNAGLSLVDAFRKELGLKLEKQPASFPALILDHIEQTPTEN